jgi:hypothetical protein
MDDLHTSIAAFLRSQRAAAARAAADLPVPSMRRQRAFACRFCAARVWEGEHGDAFHFNELWEAVSCAACHRERLRLEVQAERGTLLRQAWHRAAMVKPRCRKCGQLIGDGGVTGYDVEKLRAKRACADCYTPF